MFRQQHEILFLNRPNVTSNIIEKNADRDVNVDFDVISYEVQTSDNREALTYPQTLHRGVPEGNCSILRGGQVYTGSVRTRRDSGPTSNIKHEDIMVLHQTRGQRALAVN